MSSGPKWSLRNGSQYQRLCARAGCGAPASVTLRFQPTERQAWLVELDEHSARTQGDLCNRHAAALVLPRGWELHDERVMNGPTQLAAAAAGDASAANGNGARRVRVRRKTAPAASVPGGQLPGLEPTAGVAPNAEETVAQETVAQETVAEEPIAEVAVAEHAEAAVTGTARTVAAQFGASDDDDVDEALGAILDARTPLLQRAFRNAKPQ